MKRSVLALSVLLLAAAARADEIVLKSGKTISGTITGETEQSYRIRVGPSMALEVMKKDIARVDWPEREKAAKKAALPAKNAGTANGAAAVATSSAPAGGSPAPVPARVPAPAAATSSALSAAAPPRPPLAADTVSSETAKVGVATIIKTISIDHYNVDAKDVETAKRIALERGYHAPDGPRASYTEWSGTWKGNAAKGGRNWASMEIDVAVTITLPQWTVKRKSDEEWASWNSFVNQQMDVENQHKKIIADAVKSFALSATNLTAVDENKLRDRTNALFNQTKSTIDKRRQGFERRRTMPKPVIPKKK
ncbi:MAG: DUF922 domain-containing protein [Elusimicrobia bacterium]|nr:DUF922 domain-containing protein [Elusimicrobiota bacterium]